MIQKSLQILIPTMAIFSTAHAENKPLTVGASIPALSCPDQDGNIIDLTKFTEKGLTLVYFYPKASTSGCTSQGCSLRDNWSELEKKGVKVLGVSHDTQEAQKSFRNKNQFPFPLLADTDKKIITAFQGSTIPLLNMARRQAYLFRDGKCIMTDYDGHTSDQAQQILDFLNKETK